MLIICNGAFKSGSSWLHAILVELSIVKKLNLQKVPRKYTNDINSPTTIIESQLANFLLIEDYNLNNYLTKSHFFKNKDLFYPHNLFFEIATEFGIITLLFFLVYLLQSIYLSSKLNLQNKLQAGNMMFYTFLFLFFNSMISGDLNDARLLFIFLPLMLVKEIE